MADIGGQTTQAGISYQDKIAALYLGRLIDPRATQQPADQQVIEVRGEKPGVEVDDVVVRYADGHTIYIQAKTALADSGKPWEKLWEHFYHQRHVADFHSPQDRLVLWLGNPEDWYKTLKTICKKAASSENAAEWLERLSPEKIQALEKIRLLVNKLMGAVADTSDPGSSQTQGTEGKDSLQDEAMYSLMGCINLRFTEDDTLEEEYLVSWMPDCNVNHAALFSHLVKLVLDGAKEGRAIRQADLLQALARLEVQVKPLEQQSEFPVAKRCDYYDYIALPPNLVPRPELLAEVRQTLLDNPDGVALTSALQMRALQGMGGIGKSVMARLLCEDAEVQAEYPDGILWTTLGKTPDIRQKLKEWSDALGLRPEVLNPSPEQYKNELAKALKKRHVLLVVDDVWDGAHLAYFLVGGLGCQHLITTRIAKLAETAGAQLCPVPAMIQDEAVALLEQWARGSLDNTHYDEKLKVVARLRRLPLAVKLSGAKLQKMPLQKWLAQFDRLRRLDAEPDSADPEKSLEASFQLSLDGLKAKHQGLYLALGIFPEDEHIPDAPVIRLWQALDPSLDAGDSQSLLEFFAGQALLDRTDEQNALHGLMRQFMQEKLRETGDREMHQCLLQAYAETKMGEGWHTLPDDGYIYAHLAWHMRQARQNKELYQLISKEWKDAKFARYFNHRSFSQDVDIAIQVADEEKNLPELVRLCLLYATLGELATNAPPEVLGVLARCGQAETALGYAALVQEAEKRCEVYQHIGQELLVIGEIQKGIVALHHALEEADKNLGVYEVDITLSKVAGSLAQAGDREGALAAAEKISHVNVKEEALSDVVQALVLAGDREGAQVAVNRIEDGWLILETLVSGATILAEIGDREGSQDLAWKAFGIADQIDEFFWKVYALSKVAELLAMAGDGKGAQRTAQQALIMAEKIEYSEGKATALRSVAQALAQCGDIEGAQGVARQALVVSEKIEYYEDKMEALSGVAEVLAQCRDREGVQNAVRMALMEIEKIDDEVSKTEALSEVTEGLPQIYDWEEELATAEKNESEWSKVRVLRWAVQALAQSGDREGALVVVKKIESRWSKAEALSEVVEALARFGNREGAKVVARLALAAAEEIEDCEDKVIALSEVADALVQCEDREGAQSVVRLALVTAEKIKEGWHKVRALYRMMRAPIRSRDREGMQIVPRQALAAMEEIEDNCEEKVRALSAMAKALAQIGDREGAQSFARLALAVADKMEYYEDKVIALSEVADALVQCGDREGALGAARQALAVAEKIGGEIYKTEVLSEVAEALAQVGDREGALMVVKKIEEYHDKVRGLYGLRLPRFHNRFNPRDRLLYLADPEKTDIYIWSIARVLSEVAHALAQSGDWNGALVAAEKIEEGLYKVRALSVVAKSLAQAGDRKGAQVVARQARAMAEEVENNEDKVEALSEVVGVLAQSDDREGAQDVAKLALTTAEKIEKEWGKMQALNRVAQALAQAGDREGAQGVARQALATEEKIDDVRSKPYALSGVAHALAKAGDREGAQVVARLALATAEKIEEEWDKGPALSRVVQMLAQSSNREEVQCIIRQALAIAEQIENYKYKAEALSGVARELARSGDWEEALAIVEKIKVRLYKAQILSAIALVLAQVGDREGARGAARQALAVGEKLEEWYKAEALSGVAQTLAQAGDPQAFEVFRRAMQTARYASRVSVFSSIEKCAPLLADLDQGKTLRQITDKMLEVDSWWSN